MNRISPDIRADQLELTAGELHVWIADLDLDDSNEGANHLNHLSAEELERAAHFHNRLDGERWARSRALLRSLLGSYLGADPAELCFQFGEHGKPRLTRCEEHSDTDQIVGAELCFNLSHSGGLGLYVFALDCEVGCDVQMGGRDIDVLAVAKRAWGEEAAERLRSLEREQREREFRQMWVRHEARLKCLGAGLGAPSGTRARECWLIGVDVDEPAVAAVAAEHPARRVEVLDANDYPHAASRLP